MALYKHQIEKKLQDHERWLVTTLRSIGDAVITTDESGRVTFMNPVAEFLTGWSQDEVLGQDLAEVFTTVQDEETGLPVENPVMKLLQDGKASGSDECILVARNSNRIPVEHNAAPIKDDSGRVTGGVLVFRDITERKQAEAALQLYTLELQARNEDLDAFGHTVAHNLKGILGRIIGFAEAVHQYHDSLDAPAVREYLKTIARNGRKMGNVIDELLLLAGIRQEKIELQPINNMAAIVAETRQRLADMIEEYQAEITAPGEWPAVLGYGPWIEEVWANYISNGIKYGGRPPRLELGATPQPDGMVRFWVRDNGVGVNKEDQARLFKPFTQLGQVRTTGHGLGLSIVSRIVEKLGGQVQVESEGVPDQGSVFSFTLPAVSMSEDEPQPAENLEKA
jgi:PAS domain S-box-containing protein